jgi:hypothetical protein
VTGAIVRVTAGGLAAVLALLLAGCGTDAGTSAPKPDGPLGKSYKNVGGQCFWTPRGNVGTFAVLTFGNSGGPARISKVTLAGARDLRPVAAWVVPVTGTDLWGVFDGYPPHGMTAQGLGAPVLPGEHWAARQRADGAVIPHLPGQEVENLVIVLKPSGNEGTARTEYVYYRAGGTNYVLDLGASIQLFNGNEHGCGG